MSRRNFEDVSKTINGYTKNDEQIDQQRQSTTCYNNDQEDHRWYRFRVDVQNPRLLVSRLAEVAR